MTVIDERPGQAGRVNAEAVRVRSAFADLPYPRRFTRFLPTLHRRFNDMNRWFAVPALRLGLGRYWSNPFTGYIMLLRTTGRKSGVRREAPLGYVIVGDAVYCMAGFGRTTYWFQNLLADPSVEIVLPGRTFSGIAKEVTDPAEMGRVVRPLAESMTLIAGLLTGVNPRTASDDEVRRVYGAFPIVRIRATGVAAGPDDPGGRGWIVSNVLASMAAIWAAGLVRRAIRRHCGE